MTASRVIVVDDDADIASAVAEAATVAGTVSRTALGGREFRTQWEKEPADIVVLDIFLPEIDGFETIQWLADRGARPRLIIISGYDQSYLDSAQALALALGLEVASTIKKPFSMTDN